MDSIQLFGLTLTPVRLRLLILLAAVLAMAYLVYDGIWPKVQAYQDLRAKIADQSDLLARTRQGLRSKPELQALLAKDEAQLAALRGRIPGKQAVLSVLLVDLDKLFAKTRNHMDSFTPSAFTRLGRQGDLADVGRITVAIQAEGTYPEAIDLFEHLARYEHVIQIDTPSFSPASDQKQEALLNYTFNLTTYALDR